ncbi:unnamed protein product [Notodromas monacha]|uniref:Endoplasmic reticulum-Golgi intermediate compartment protein 3 n=1 Tax=Notodromas monacha TaxID=399045 RepID=A0A7R9BDD3_9CRUS|nr:unnamed protein product [Notodromas monacha]CAG0912434.1 unnamed protein product [Notodromas monacha]
MGNGVLDQLRRFDAYPKTLEDFRIKTFSGASVTILGGLVMVLLFISELRDYLRVEMEEQLFVDTTRGEKLIINFDVVFPRMACGFVSIDAMDASGVQLTNIQHNVFKRRLNPKGEPLSDPVKHEVLGTLASEVMKNKSLSGEEPAAVESAVLDPNAPPGCGSCYGAESPRKRCCDTCQDVKDAYQMKGWRLMSLDDVVQCQEEAKKRREMLANQEGCQIYGYLSLNRVGGNFHFAPGHSFTIEHIHVHDLGDASFENVNMSHTIRHLSFGQKVLDRTNPLDGFDFASESGLVMVQYLIKIIPTTYQKSDGSVFETNQFSVRKQFKNVGHRLTEGSMPGVFCQYDFAPLMVKYSEKRKYLGHFLASLCAIIGGVFTVAGLLDSFLFHSHQLIKRKFQLGKLH